jgi:hypothetical protein
MFKWLLVSVIVAMVFFVVIPSLNKSHAEPDLIREMKENILPYSGLNETLYLEYINNLDLFGNNINNIELASVYFYNALENLYELQLTDQDFDFTEQIHQNALTGEQLLMNSALEQSSSFHPKYLNNMNDY